MQIIQKLSARPPPLETRINLIREIASENDLALPLNDPFNLGSSLGARGSDDSLKRDPHFVRVDVDSEGDEPRRMEFKDVFVAAQVAFESAAYAAAAARAAVELSRSHSRHLDQ